MEKGVVLGDSLFLADLDYPLLFLCRLSIVIQQNLIFLPFVQSKIFPHLIAERDGALVEKGQNQNG